MAAFIATAVLVALAVIVLIDLAIELLLDPNESEAD